MSRHKKKHVAPIPPDNLPQGEPSAAGDPSETPDRHQPTTGASFQEHDAKRRLGNFSSRGEHPRQQPGRANDGDIHSR
jgi:hypothetical protein